MAIKSDKWIKSMCKEMDMISPFVEGQIAKISYRMAFHPMDMI